MSKRLLLFILLIAAATGGYAQDAWKKGHQPTLVPQQSGTTQLLIAVSPVNSRVVWAAGAGGTYVVTTDGGSTWRPGVVPGAESLQFRDVQGISDRVAYLMSIGTTPEIFASTRRKTPAGTGPFSLRTRQRTPSMTASRSGVRIAASRTAIQSTEYFPTFALTMARLGTRSPTVCHLPCQAKLRSLRAEPASLRKDGKTPGLPPAAQA
jgi:hypothetical protein